MHRWISELSLSPDTFDAAAVQSGQRMQLVDYVQQSHQFHTNNRHLVITAKERTDWRHCVASLCIAGTFGCCYVACNVMPTTMSNWNINRAHGAKRMFITLVWYSDTVKCFSILSFILLFPYIHFRFNYTWSTLVSRPLCLQCIK